MKRKIIRLIEGMMANIVEAMCLGDSNYEKTIYKAQYDILQELLERIKQ